MPATRLAIFTTHPIQYQAPWFRALAASPQLDIEVMFSHVPSAVEQGAAFGTSFTWDIPLLTGYPHTVLASRLLPARVAPFVRRWSRGIGAALDRSRPQAAMVLGWQDISLVQALIACRRRGIPVILRGESNALRRRPRLVSLLHRSYFSLCDAFLAIGRANADLYRAAGVTDNRIVTAGYCVDNDRFVQAAAGLAGKRLSIRRAWGIPDLATCFAFVGKLEPKKNVLHALDGLRLARTQGKAVHALVVGAGEQMQAARDFCAAHALPTAFAGFLNQTEIPRAYAAADALILPSDFGETWGLVVNEAMASGLPVIVSDRVGSANDLVVDGATGFVFPYGDIAALAAHIARLTDREEMRRSMGMAARRRVASDYSIERAVRQTLAAVALVTSGRHAAA
jgi:glycosyltransferase involved in cell wall biosynthesis